MLTTCMMETGYFLFEYQVKPTPAPPPSRPSHPQPLPRLPVGVPPPPTTVLPPSRTPLVATG